MSTLLEEARSRSTIKSEIITNLIYGGPHAVKRRREITFLFENDPCFDKWDRPFLNHTSRYIASVEKCQAFHLKCEKLGLIDPVEVRWAYQAVDDILPTE
jgi:hypothetical protein